jgi:hypothetical protein
MIRADAVRRAHRNLVDALSQVGVRLLPGSTFTATVVASDDGDVELDLVVTVRRRASRDAIKGYRAAALDEGGQLDGLRSCSHVGWGCQIYTKPKGWLKGGGHRCTAKVMAAVVYQTFDGKTGFRFVCSRHRAHNGVDPAQVLAIVELPPVCLDPLRRQWHEQQGKREAERQAQTAAGLCPKCGKVEDDGTCGWHDVVEPSVGTSLRRR